MYITSSKQPLFILLGRVSKFPFRMWFVLYGSQVQAQGPIQPKPLIMVVMGLAIKLSLSNQDTLLDVCWPIQDNSVLLLGVAVSSGHTWGPLEAAVDELQGKGIKTWRGKQGLGHIVSALRNPYWSHS